ENRADEVGQEVAGEDAPLGQAAGAAGLDERLAAEREHLSADDAGHREPAHEPDRDEEHDDASGAAAVEGDLEEDDDQDVGQAVEDVDQTHEQRVDPPAAIAGDEADG